MLKQYLDIYIIRPNMETRNFVRTKQFGYSQRQKLVKKNKKTKKKTETKIWQEYKISQPLSHDFWRVFTKYMGQPGKKLKSN